MSNQPKKIVLAPALLLLALPLLISACSQESNQAKPLLQFGPEGLAAEPKTARDGGVYMAPVGGVHVISYGPALVAAAVPFNRQPDGQSALWMKLSEDVSEAHVAIYFAGVKLVTLDEGTEVTALVPPANYSKPGKYPIFAAGDLMGREFRTETVYINAH